MRNNSFSLYCVLELGNIIVDFLLFKKKELEAELVNVTGAAKPTRKIR